MPIQPVIFFDIAKRKQSALSKTSDFLKEISHIGEIMREILHSCVTCCLLIELGKNCHLDTSVVCPPIVEFIQQTFSETLIDE